ncbi:hypothetical protein [Synechococcus sp. UW69]|uniref:hypothetical protein n=1 Tax=Synechococcus sp. UW69 TaxID=368493 RepID=UPI0010BD0082|nr:hypothetical protein [Synechococcus sp. UW69]
MTSSITPFSLATNNNYNRILVCAHDAGSAHLILHWIKHFRQKCLFVLSGPAFDIFSDYFGSILNHQFDTILETCDCVISGTSWSSDIEDIVRRFAKKHNIFSIAVVDHWVNYVERFTFSGSIVLPDLLWVSDNYAFEISTRLFPNLAIILVENSWLVHTQNHVLCERIKRFSQPFVDKFRIIYLLEPIRSNWNLLDVCPEFYTLDYFTSKIQPLISLGYIPSNTEIEIIFRPHPAQNIDFYNPFFASMSSDFLITIDSNSNLYQSLVIADLVCGLNSQALVVAMACNIQSMSVLPPVAPTCILPHSQLLHLKSLV